MKQGFFNHSISHVKLAVPFSSFGFISDANVVCVFTMSIDLFNFSFKL